ncbi:unnamed protein product [Rotaria magnacalcarata]|nr:unnamed protein product [Rotaria magnacalcarata]CAF1679204.1 unnamed protein product [Rotaria magnacalcarata]CAF4523526.1 unnamed protein product [Rotaria magnacalcarata]
MVECAQPYFPTQIVFSPDDGLTIFAIDEINQRAYVTYPFTPSLRQTAFVMQHFPYTVPDSPQSKYYVQLSIVSPMNSCMFGTYWKYGGNMLNFFPLHWVNGSSFELKNYMKFNYEMIHSNDSSVDEDYWYSNETCSVDTGDKYPCQEIYFEKNTDIPRRSVEVRRAEWKVIQITTYFTILSIGKPNEKYFNSIPKDWFHICRDDDLEVLYNPQRISIGLHESVKIQVWLRSPPHRIDGNDTVTIQWKSINCTDCFTLSPKEFIFNIKNFHERQALTITRLKNTEQAMIIPIFNGGGFDLVTPDDYPINIQ